MEVIPYWPSQHQEISKLALHSTQEYQAGSPVSFACRFVSVLIRFTVPGRYGSCRFGFYGSVRFAGTLPISLMPESQSVAKYSASMNDDGDNDNDSNLSSDNDSRNDNDNDNASNDDDNNCNTGSMFLILPTS